MWVIAQGVMNHQSQPRMVNLDSFDFIAVQEGYALDRGRWYVIARHVMSNGVSEIPLASCRSASEANALVQRIGAAMSEGRTLLELVANEEAEKPTTYLRTTKDLALLARR